jgi:hypothetical protein
MLQPNNGTGVRWFQGETYLRARHIALTERGDYQRQSGHRNINSYEPKHLQGEVRTRRTGPCRARFVRSANRRQLSSRGRTGARARAEVGACQGIAFSIRLGPLRH